MKTEPRHRQVPGQEGMEEMRRKKFFWGVAAGVLAALAVVLILAIFTRFFFFAGFRIFSKNARSLNLLGKGITVEEYETIRKNAPGCNVLWDVPFQGSTYPSDTKELTISSLTGEDAAQLDYFPLLESVHAESCTDYDQLLALEARRPEVELIYDVRLNGESFSRTVTEVNLSGITEAEIPSLANLPQLETVTVSGGSTPENFDRLQVYCKEHGITFCVEAAGQRLEDTTETVTLKAVTDEEMNLLPLLAELKQVHFVDPEASAEKLIQYRQDHPDAAVTWEKQIWGKTVLSTKEEVEELDLSDGEVGTLEQVEEAMTYFPEIQKVFLGDCGIDYEEIAAYRERVRPEYKVAWIVQCGKKLPTRTDATSFMPARDGVGYIKDDVTVNLRYCEDMIAIDVGHMGIRDISFVSYMPNLKYLILAHTEVSDITPISSCKNLVFLELDWSPIKDYTPLQGCTALEDLNIGEFGADVTPLYKMTWLKNLWCIDRPASYRKLAENMPSTTKVVGFGSATVAMGWRDLPNYYAMRDALGMYYMSW